MTSEELKELLDYIQDNYSSFPVLKPVTPLRTRFNYVNVSYDTREGVTVKGKIWKVMFIVNEHRYITFTGQACNLDFIKQTLSESPNNLRYYLSVCREFEHVSKEDPNQRSLWNE